MKSILQTPGGSSKLGANAIGKKKISADMLAKMLLIILFCLSGLPAKVYAQPTSLAAGDAAIIGFNAQTTDRFSIVLLKDINANTVINVTDNGILSGDLGRTNEGFVTYTAPAAQTKGTVLTWFNGMTIAGTGWSSNNPTNFAINGSGDQLFLFQGSTGNWGTQSGITLIYGANFGVALSATSASANTLQPSSLPAPYFLNLPTATYYNCYFANAATSATTVTVSGTQAALLALFSNGTKWFGGSGSQVTFPTWNITVSSGSTPTIATTGTLSAVNTTYGTASGFTSFSVSGTNLTNNITISAPSGFEISKTAGGASGYASSQSLAQSGGTVAATTIYVRLAATTVFGSYSGNVTLAASPASATVATVSSSVAKKGLTVSNAIGTNKTYNRTAAATISGATAVGTVNGDNITISGGGTFANVNVGDNIPITPALTFSGTNATSYTLTQPTGLNADITPKNVTVSAVTANNKVYDGNTDATISGTLSGVIAPDDVTLNTVASFESPFVGAAVPVTSLSSLIGESVGNYFLVQPSGLSADITPKELTIIGATAQNKVFDGNTDAMITGTLSGVIAPDDVTLVGTGTFASAAVGLNIPVISTSAITGDIANYTLVQPTGLTANISAGALLPQNIAFDPLTDMVYGSPDFTLTASATSALTVSYSSSDPNVATVSGNTVTIVGVGTTTITATQSGDLTYDAAEPVTQSLTVTPKELSILNAAASDKVYDGNDVAVISGTLSGIVGADEVSFTSTATFATATAGNDIAVTATASLIGNDAINYTIAQPQGLAADITPKTLTVSGATAFDKTYDGNTNTTISGANLNGVVGADVVTVSGSGIFASSHVANNIAVTAALVLSGNDAANYTLTQPTGLIADITPASLSISGLSADNKTYDGTTAATISGTAGLQGIIGSDVVTVSGTATGTFNNKNVGTSKPVSLAGLSLSGADAGNYTLSAAAGATADITVKSITISGASAQDKTFDGTTAAVITGTLSGIIAPDAVTLAGTGTFASSSVGSNIAVTSTATLTGADSGNYTIDPQPTGLTANILAAPTVLANWTYETLIGSINMPSPNVGTGSSGLAGSMSGLSLATGMNTATGCGAQTSGTSAWAIATAAPGTNESSGARFNTSTTGYRNIKFTWEQRWSNTSANTVRLQYTTNGTTWTNFTMTDANTVYCLGSLNNGRYEVNAGDQYRRISVDLSSIIAVNNNANFGVRIVAAQYQATGQFRQANVPASVATGGTWRFDNVKFEATQIPLEPSTAAVLSGTTTICAGSSANLSVNITGGTAPFVVTYTDGTNQYVADEYISGNNIGVEPTATTTYSLVSVVDANALTGTGLTGTAIVTVNQLYPFFADADSDGYGTGSAVQICAIDANTPPAGFAVLDGDCNDSVAALHPNAVEVPYNGVDDDCDGSIDETGTVTTTLLTGSCGVTLASIQSLVGIQTVGGHNITGYRIRIANGSEIQVIEKTVPHFTFPQFTSYAYATTYTVDIQLQRAGIWQASWGSACLVSTPAILEEGGAAAVSPSQCGIILPKINTLIATGSIQGVTGYRFRVTNLTDPNGPNAIQQIDRAQNWFSLQMLTRYNFGTMYRIEVAVKTTGTYSGFGAPCEVNSPAAPSLVNCGGVAASGTATIAATSVQGATQYRFQIVRDSDGASTTMDRSTNWFIFNSIPAAAFSPGVLYNIRVAVMTTGSWSPFGDICQITSPGSAAKGIPTGASVAKNADDVQITAYPNPFTADFGIDIITANQQKVQVKVYDMLGRLVESKETEATAIQRCGSHYPSGVYNVIVSQGDVVKTLRMVKR